MKVLIEQKDELANLQDDLIREQEAVDCLKQIIVVVDDQTEEQSFTDLENKLSTLSDRWSNVCKFVGNRWIVVQELLIKLQGIDKDFNDVNVWIGQKSIQLKDLVNKINQISSDSSSSSSVSSSTQLATTLQLLKILKDIELDMQRMHSKLNEMNDTSEQINSQLNNSPQLASDLNKKMDTFRS